MQVEHLDGSREMPIPFNTKKLKEALSRKDVKEIHVFNLKPGIEVQIKGRNYKLNSINNKGKKVIAHFIHT